MANPTVCLLEAHPKRQEIIDAILAGESLRKVGKMAGCSHTAVQAFKRKLQPSIARAAALADLEAYANKALKETSDDKETQANKIKALTRAVADADTSALWRSRADSLWNRGDKYLSDAELARKVYHDKDGNPVFDGADFSAITGVMNQLHRNLELTGRAWGVLREDQAAGVHVENMLVVLPRADRPAAALEPVEPGTKNTIEIKATESTDV